MDEVKIGSRNSASDQKRLQMIHDYATENGAICGKKSIDMDDELVLSGSEIKALGNGKVGGYLVRYSTKDDPDLTDDFFTKDTNLVIPENLPVIYHHGLDKELGKRVIGKAVITFKDAGAWAETQLNMRDEYEQRIYEMAEKGKLGYSSGALSHLVERELVGKGVSWIKSWFVGEASLTPTPAEPRNTIVSLKSLLTSDQAALPIEDDTNKTKQGVIKMSDQTVDIAKEVAAAVKSIRDAELAELATKAAQQKAIDEAKAEGAKEAVEELKKKGALKASEYHTTEPTNDSDEGMGAFKSWMQTGQINRELIEPGSSWTKTSGVTNLTEGAEGGYAVPDPLLNRIIAKRDLASWVRQAPCQVFQTEADHILIPKEDTRYADFTSTAESAAYTNDTTGNIAQVNLALTKYTTYLKVSEEFMAAKNSNWESWMAGVLGRVEAGTENDLATAVIVAGATAGTAFGTTAVITAAELSRCIGELSNGYAVTGEAGFLMKNGVKWYCKGISGNNFSFINTPMGGDFFGFPAYVSDDMDENTTGLTPVIFANFNYFGVVETPGMVVQRNPYLYMANGQVGIFANIRRGYAVLQAEAIRKYNSVS
jgi:HK97 family phage major capsid protein